MLFIDNFTYIGTPAQKIVVCKKYWKIRDFYTQFFMFFPNTMHLGEDTFVVLIHDKGILSLRYVDL